MPGAVVSAMVCPEILTEKTKHNVNIEIKNDSLEYNFSTIFVVAIK
jgi:hypothetical protein